MTNRSVATQTDERSERPAPTRDVVAGAPADAPAAPRTDFTYRPALDGLRAFAVLAVMLYHAGVDSTPGGFLGVDVFFVISGYLITSLLLSEHQRSSRIDLRGFWARRARRLLPAIILVVAFTAIYARHWALVPDRSSIRGDAIATLLYVSNWHFIFSNESYFTQFLFPSPLRHTWSLAIEEQWYFLWPIAVAVGLAFTRGRLRLLTGLVLVLAVASAVEMAILYTPGRDPSRVYYGTDTRAQTLLIGSALALILTLVPRDGRVIRAATQVVGAVALVGVIFVIMNVSDRNEDMYRGGFFVFAIASAAVIAALVSPHPNILKAVFSIPVLRWIGIISYGLYLWHWPIFLVISPSHVNLTGNQLLVTRFGVTFIVAIVSFFLIERPIRTRGLRSMLHLKPRLAPIAITAIAMMLAAGLVIGATARDGSFWRPAPSWSQYLASLKATGEPPKVTRADGSYLPRALLVGDSSTFMLSLLGGDKNRSDAAWKTDAVIGCGVAFLSAEDTPPAKECTAQPKRWRDDIKSWDPDLVVLNWGPWETVPHYLDGEKLAVGSPEYRDYLDAQLERAIRIFTSQDAQIALLEVPCYGPGNNLPLNAERAKPEHVATVNDIFRTVAARHPDNVHFVEWSGFLCPNGKYANKIDGTLMRDDGVHVTRAGAVVVWQQLQPLIDPLAAQAQTDRGVRPPVSD